MFYISISNGLLKDGHPKRMGSAVWEFMWCIDKVTMIDKSGVGWVLGRKPIKLQEIAETLGVHETTISRNLATLEDLGYITKINAPYGIVIGVNKAKKRFSDNAKAPSDNAKAPSDNAKANKTIQKTITDDSIAAKQVSQAKEIAHLIKLFEPINPNYDTLFGNKTERSALVRLIDKWGYEKVESMIAALPHIVSKPYAPKITTPWELEKNLAKLVLFTKQEKAIGGNTKISQIHN